MTDGCPSCGSDLQGPPIPDDYRRKGLYGPYETAPTHYSRLVGVEVSGIYDGVLYWQCPDCGHAWPRFEYGHRLGLASATHAAKARQPKGTEQ